MITVIVVDLAVIVAEPELTAGISRMIFVFVFIVTIFSLATASLFRAPLRLIPDLFAVAWWVILVLIWVSWNIFQRDLSSIKEDATVHPEYWIPSGTLSVRTVEEISFTLRGALLIGSLFLGLPVAIPVWILVFAKDIPPQNSWRDALPLLFLSLSSYFVSQKDIVASNWSLRILGAGVLLAIAPEFLAPILVPRRSRSRLAITIAVMTVCVGLSGQPVLWMSTIPVLAVMILIGWKKPDFFSQILPLFFEIALGIQIFVFFIFPAFFEH